MLLCPGEQLNEIVRYVLAVAAERFGVLLHSFCFMSNHFHLVLTDPRRQLPAFEQYFASLIARSCNALHGHWESFWAPGSYSAVVLLDERTVFDKMAYTLANPVSAGLVRRGSEWPGVWSSPNIIGGKPATVSRPDHFFRAEGPMPDAACLRVVPPPGVESVEDFRRALKREVQRREDEKAQRLASEHKSFLGVRRVLAQRPLDRPLEPEPRRKMNPRVACQDEEKRREAIEKLQEFVRTYREAWKWFASGLRSVLFPHGTYWMRVAYRVACSQAG